jgi:rhodanese-related sulfurtransferase
MERLLEYISHHSLLASLAVAMALAVLVFELRNRSQNFSGLQPQEAIRLMNQGAQVYDLRNREAYAAGHVTGAKHLDPGQVDSAGETLKRLKERTLLLVCEDGQLATKLTRQLHAGGFTKVFNLRGGLAAWRAEGLPLQRG